MKHKNQIQWASVTLAAAMLLAGGCQSSGHWRNGGPTPSRLEAVTLDTELVPGSVDVAVLLPPGFEPGSTPHTLLLWLHGGPDDSSYLSRELRPIIEAAWKRKELPPLVVAVPSARRSFYMDYQDGTEKWESLILEEVILTLRKKYGLRKDKGGTLIGGYSMGGMGSLRMAFKHPKRFGAVAAIAPAIEPAYQFKDIQPRDREYRTDAIFERTYGKPVDHDFWQANHPPTLARDRAAQIKDSKLKVYFEVGDADELGLFRGGEFLHDTLLQKNVSHEYRLVHGAKHEDESLPARLADAMRFLGRVSGGVDAQAAREVEAHMERYVKLFNNEQAEVIAGGIYLAPVLTWESHGKKQYADITEKDVSEDFDSSFKMMKVNGWKQSVIHGMDIRIGGKDLAFVDMSFSRLMADGKPIPPVQRTWSYVLVKRESGWRIISAHGQSDVGKSQLLQIREAVKSHMDRYVALFNDEQAEVIAKEIYLPPLQIRKFGDESHAIATTTEEIHEQFRSMFAKIKAKGWKRSVVHGMDIHVGGEDLAFIDMRFSRLTGDGKPIPPAQRIASYVLVKRSSGWRIISVLGQAPPAN